MRHVTVLAVADGREETLGRLRELGLLHVTVNTGAAETNRVREAQRMCADTEHTIRLVQRAAKNKSQISNPNFQIPIPQTVSDILALEKEIPELEAKREILEREERRYAPFGDFDPAQIHALAAAGIHVVLFKCPAKKFPPKIVSATCVALGKTGTETGAVAFGFPAPGLGLPSYCTQIGIPALAPAETRARLAETRDAIAQRNAALAAAAPLVPQFAAALETHREQSKFATAWESMDCHGAVDSISGFLPAEDVPKLQNAATEQGWGVVAREPAAGENVPVLLRPPKMFRPVLELFKFLNINPAYNESDVSVPFYTFFTLFAAMILGDAGYGVVILAALFLSRKKMAKVPQLRLFGNTLGFATLAWGVLTASYFGIPAEHLPAFLAHPLSRWFADSNHMMFFCFIIGATHLSLARLWNAILLFPSTKAIAQFGWVGVLWAIFCFVCSIVVAGFTMPKFTAPLAAVSFAVVMLFSVAPRELKRDGFQLAMIPLSLFSAMGDMISYLRLFAIGLASAQVALNFNLLATGLDLPAYIKIPAAVLIVVFAHSLNLILGGISVIVHAVRLNTLEFANAKGITWSGSSYNPFKKQQTQ